MEFRPNVLLCLLNAALNLAGAVVAVWLAVWVVRSPNTFPTAPVLPALVGTGFASAAVWQVFLACRTQTFRIDEAGLHVSLPGRHGLVPWGDMAEVDIFRPRSTLRLQALFVRLKEGVPNGIRGPLAWLCSGGPRILPDAVDAPVGSLHCLLLELAQSAKSREQLRRPGWVRERLGEISRERNT